MSFLAFADYPELRSLIDTTLTSMELPDVVIEGDAYLGDAEREVVRFDPDAASRTGDEWKAVRLATMLFTAARLLPALPRIVSETTLSSTYRLQPINVAERVSELRQRAEAALLTYIDPDSPLAIGSVFVTVAGCRGR